MSEITLKISLDNGMISKKVKFNTSVQIYEVHKVIEDKVFDGAAGESE